LKKLRYKEGDVFGIPLRTGGYALGLIARMPKNGKILLGYFFGYYFETIPSPNELPSLKPEHAIWVHMFGDLNLWKDVWPIVMHIYDWENERKIWPMPQFVLQDRLGLGSWLVTYEKDDPSKELSRVLSKNRIDGHWDDGLAGAGYVEIMMTKLLTESGLRTRGQPGDD
jgi:hypothetical protein